MGLAARSPGHVWCPSYASRHFSTISRTLVMFRPGSPQRTSQCPSDTLLRMGEKGSAGRARFAGPYLSEVRRDPYPRHTRLEEVRITAGVPPPRLHHVRTGEHVAARIACHLFAQDQRSPLELSCSPDGRRLMCRDSTWRSRARTAGRTRLPCSLRQRRLRRASSGSSARHHRRRSQAHSSRGPR